MNIKNLGIRLLGGLLVAVLAVSTANAQQQQRQTPQPGPIAVPDKVFGWFENNRIFVQVEIVNSNQQPNEFANSANGTFREGERFGNRIGNVIPVRFRIYLIKPTDGQDEIQVDFSSLAAQPARLTIQAIENQDWWLASKEVLAKDEEPLRITQFPNARLDWGGKVYECSQMVQLDMIVQSFKDPRYRINLWLEFTYAASKLPGGALDWKPLETPDYWVDYSRVADPGNDLSIGNTNTLVQPRPAFLAYACIGGGLFIGLTVVSFWVTRRLRRGFGSRESLDDQERLWSVVSPILAQRRVEVANTKEAYALTHEDIIRILDACNDFINATEENTVNVSAWTLQEVRDHRLDIKDGERWFHVLEPLRTIIQTPDGNLEPDRYGRIVAMLREICPRP